MFLKKSHFSSEKMKDLGLDFLQAKKNLSGLYIDDVWRFTDFQLEHFHDYIQWIFPLDAPSEHCFKSPVINRFDIEKLNQNSLALIQKNMIKSLTVMLRFYGFDLMVSRECPVVIKYNFDEKKSNWCVMYSHNHLRITRILKSLKLFKLDQYAAAFYSALIEAEAEEKKTNANELGYLVNLITLQYWKEAVV